MTDLARIVAPESIAIVGLSADLRKHGGRVLASLRKLGYRGRVWGVHPRMPEVDGVPMFASLRDLPHPPDLVASAVPASAVPGVVRDAGTVGAGGVIVFAGGFAEAGADGSAAQDRLTELAAETGVRLLGPNSGGVIRPAAGLAVSFLTCLDRPAEEIRSGPVGLVTQSGGTGSYIHNLAAERGGGLGISISVGNEADVDISDGITELAGLTEITAIAVVLETVRDGPAFVRAVTAANDAGKPVVVCRLGASDHGRAMTSTHTGALAVPARVLDGALASVGVTLTETPAELLDVAEVMARTGRRPGRRVGIVTHSGGVAILLSDLAERLGVDLPHPSERLRAGLAELLDHGTAANPLDMGGIIGGASRFGQVVDRFVASGEYDAVLAVSTAHPRSHSVERAEALVAGDPGVIHLWMAGDVGSAGEAILRSAGAPLTTEPRAAVKALAGLTSPIPEGLDVPPRRSAARSRTTLDEAQSKDAIARWGVATPLGRLVTSPAEAARVASELGGRVVVKVASPDIAHKTEVGGVATGVPPDGAASAFTEIIERVRRRVPSAVITGAIVEEHVDGFEVIVGGVTDERFGPMVLLGLGGVAAEAFEPAMALPAVTVEQAAALRDRVPGLNHALGRIDASAARRLDKVVASVAAGFAKSEVVEFEVNPLAWSPQGWVALDALVVHPRR